MGLFDRLFGRRQSNSPAAEWLARRAKADPETVIREHFAAMAAHDLEWLLATLTPERSLLYAGPTTLDKRKVSVAAVRLLAIAPADDAPVDGVVGYPEMQTFRVEYELDLVPSEQRRDPSLLPGRQWSYFLLARQRPGQPWLIADWGR